MTEPHSGILPEIQTEVKHEMGMTIERRFQVTLNYTADEWELYTSLPGAQAAAGEINDAVEAAVNAGLTRREVEKALEAVMHRHADLGARDSEPQYKLERVLDKIYGKEVVRW